VEFSVKNITVIFLLFLCTCTVQTLVIDPVELNMAKKHLLPKKSIYLGQDTVIVDSVKLLKIKYLGKRIDRVIE
jgi:hypothetical protein